MGSYYDGCKLCDFPMLSKPKMKSRQAIKEIKHCLTLLHSSIMERHLGIGIDWNILDWICWHWNLIILYSAQIYQLMLSCQHDTMRDVCISASLAQILHFPLLLWIRGSWLWNLCCVWAGLFLSRQLYPPKIPGTHFWPALLWCRSLAVPEVLVCHEEQVRAHFIHPPLAPAEPPRVSVSTRVSSVSFSCDCVSLWDFLA